MKRHVLALALTTALFLPIVGVTAGTSTQDDNDDRQATIEASQTADDQVTPATDESTEESAEGRNPSAEDVLYEADTTGGFDEWTGPVQWLHRDGNLLNDGTENRSVIFAPYQPTVSDYAVEAEIRLVRCNNDSDGSFGLIARAVDENGYYRAGHYCYAAGDIRQVMIEATGTQSSSADTLVEEDFPVDAEWHTYRLEVRGERLQLFIDGEAVVEAADVRYDSAGQVGVYSSGMPIEVRSFRVLAL